MKNKNGVIAKDQWAEKYLREQPFMPVGSAANMFGQMFHGKGVPTKKEQEQALKFMDAIVARCQKYVQDLYQKVGVNEEEVEFQVEPKKDEVPATNQAVRK